MLEPVQRTVISQISTRLSLRPVPASPASTPAQRLLHNPGLELSRLDVVEMVVVVVIVVAVVDGDVVVKDVVDVDDEDVVVEDVVEEDDVVEDVKVVDWVVFSVVDDDNVEVEAV